MSSVRKFLPDQDVISLLGDFWQFEENALATLDPGHTPNQLQLQFEMSGTISSVTPDCFCSAFLRSTFASVPINGVYHVVKEVPSHRRADPVRWNRAMAESK